MYKSLHAYVRRNLQGVYGAENIRDQLYKIGLPGKLILSKIKGLPEVIFS